MSVRKGSSTVASRLLVKVISVPSGDHAGPMSSLGWLVRLVSPLPSRFTAQISHGSQQPLTWLCFMNTTFVLSGDQSGARSSPWKLSASGVSGVLVRLIWLEPSAFITQMSEKPPTSSRSLVKAILVPSEDQAGWASLVSGVFVRLV